MNDNKSRDIFYGVVAVATLIVALIGATLAYFSISAGSSEGAVNARSAVVSINYEDGQQVIAQAQNLIPVKFNIMQTLYRNNLAAIDAQAATEYQENESPRSNLCQDGRNPNYDVCSVYRFTVSNDSPINIRASLRTELNEFKDLYFGVRDGSCTATASNENDCWLNINYDDSDNPIKYTRLQTCDNDDTDVCYTGTTSKTYESRAISSIFGFNSASDLTFKALSVSASEHSYDVVLFILDDDTPQDYDQDKSYRGNIFVETTSGDGIITGRLPE